MSTEKAAGATLSPLLRFSILKQRSDFLRAARGKRFVTQGFVLQGWNRRDHADPRVGYTCSKKVGNAVIRNRAKRRLRAVVRRILPEHGRPGWDYVLVGRADTTVRLPFDQMSDDLAKALDRLH